jgi:hypothetical protein
MNRHNLVWTTILGTLACCVFALFFFRASFFDVNRPPLYFLLLGFAGSLSLALFKQRRVRDVIYVNLLIYLFFAVLLASVLDLQKAGILFIYHGCMIVALYVYVAVLERSVASAFVRPLVAAAVVALFYVAATLIHGLFFINSLTSTFLLANLPIGFVLGLGQGIGLELADAFAQKLPQLGRK